MDRYTVHSFVTADHHPPSVLPIRCHRPRLSRAAATSGGSALATVMWAAL